MRVPFRPLARVAVPAALLGLAFPSAFCTSSCAPLVPTAISLLLLRSGTVPRAPRARVVGRYLLTISSAYAFALVWLPRSLEGRFSVLRAAAVWVALSVYSALYPTVAIAISLVLLRHRVALSASLPALWAVAEAARAAAFGGFDWLSLGYTAVEYRIFQHLFHPIGTFGVSALLVCIATAPIDLCRLVRLRPRRHLAAVGAAGIVAICAKQLPCSHEEAMVGTQSDMGLVGVLQASGEDDWASELTSVALSGVRVVVTPEELLSFQVPPLEPGVHMLLGATVDCGWRGGRKCIQNVIRHIGPEGRENTPYAKRVLVPMYERDFFVAAHDRIIMLPGSKAVVFDVDGVRMGPIICYEIADRHLVQQLKSLDVDLIVHPTSDTWQVDRSAAVQHLNIARARAAEFRIPILRVSNRWLTRMIDDHGRIVDGLEDGVSPLGGTINIGVTRH
ncbi:MAG: nitrilase-related carbon-nitrogen hydrolase [Polyangiaceae bacterium]